MILRNFCLFFANKFIFRFSINFIVARNEGHVLCFSSIFFVTSKWSNKLASAP